MRRATQAGLGATIAALAGVLVVGLAAISPAATAPQSPAGPAHGILQPGHCYRIAFPIEGPPNYKILELVDAAWIKAEVDAGSAKSERRPIWINTGQIVTLTEARCSE